MYVYDNHIHRTIKRHVEGITTTCGARRLAEGMGNLHHLIFIQKSLPIKKLTTSVTRCPTVQISVARHHTLQLPDSHAIARLKMSRPTSHSVVAQVTSNHPSVLGSRLNHSVSPTKCGHPAKCGRPTDSHCVIKPWCLSFFTFLKQMTRVLVEIMFLAVYMHLHLHLHCHLLTCCDCILLV